MIDSLSNVDVPFLIAHKVRGEAAFDIAIKQPCAVCQGTGTIPDDPEANPICECDECEGSGHWWICSTSGHRAYPYAHVRVSEIMHHWPFAAMTLQVPVPLGCPDHYRVNATPRTSLASAGRSLLTALGLAKPKAPIRRRV